MNEDSINLKKKEFKMNVPQKEDNVNIIFYIYTHDHEQIEQKNRKTRKKGNKNRDVVFCNVGIRP